MSEWPPERVEQLKTLWAAGKSGSEIARILGKGLTRSAVIGKVHRLKIGRPAPAREATFALRGAVERRKPQVRRTYSPRPVRPKVQPAPTPEAQAAIVVDATLAKVWTERKFGECAYPITGEGADTFSCCQPAQPNGYCVGHWAIMTKPLTPTERRRFQRLTRLAA